MKSKQKLVYKLLIAVTLVLVVGMAFSGCISGINPVGWSGGAVSNNTIYLGSREGRLVAVNLADQSRQWSEQVKMTTQTGYLSCGGCGTTTTGVPVYGTPLVSGGLVYFAGYNGKIYAFNSSNIGQARWVYPRDGFLKPFVGGLVTDEKKLFIGCADGKVYALDAATGDKLWEHATGDKIWATPAFLKSTVYNGSTGQTINQDKLFIGSYDKKFYALNPADGSKIWEFPAKGVFVNTPLLFDSNIYVGSLDRNLYALKDNDGSLIWKFMAKKGFWAKPAVWNGNIYAGSLDGFVYVLKADTGEQVAALNLKDPIAADPVVVNNSVIFATRKGVVYSVNTSSNQAMQLADLKMEVDGPLTAIDDIVYFQTQNLALQRVNVTNGSVLLPVSLKS